MLGYYEVMKHFIDGVKYNNSVVLSIGNIVSTEQIYPTSYF